MPNLLGLLNPRRGRKQSQVIFINVDWHYLKLTKNEYTQNVEMAVDYAGFK